MWVGHSTRRQCLDLGLSGFEARGAPRRDAPWRDAGSGAAAAAASRKRKRPIMSDEERRAAEHALRVLADSDAARADVGPEPVDVGAAIDAAGELLTAHSAALGELRASVRKMGGEIDLAAALLCNDSHTAVREVALGGRAFLLPPRSRAVLTQLPCARLESLRPPAGFHIVTADPPWRNRSALRRGAYATHSNISHGALERLPVRALASASGCVVLVWVTNDPALLDYVRSRLLPGWGARPLATWTWLKTSADGRPMLPLDASDRKPSECAVVGIVDAGQDAPLARCCSEAAGPEADGPGSPPAAVAGCGGRECEACQRTSEWAASGIASLQSPEAELVQDIAAGKTCSLPGVDQNLLQPCTLPDPCSGPPMRLGARVLCAQPLWHSFKPPLAAWLEAHAARLAGSAQAVQRLELFGRATRRGWTCVGDQACLFNAAELWRSEADGQSALESIAL